MDVLNLRHFGGLKCCHRAVRVCCQILLALGLIAGLSLLAAAATLHGNTGPDVRLVALVYIGGLVMCVCGGLLVVFCASTAADSAFSEAALIPNGDFWSEPCINKRCYGGSHGNFGAKKCYFIESNGWTAKEAGCQLVELPEKSKCYSKTSASGSYCAYGYKCNDGHVCIGTYTSCESRMFKNKHKNEDKCNCGNIISNNVRPDLQKCHTVNETEGARTQNAPSADETGLRGSISCGKSGTAQNTFSCCDSQSKYCANCNCLERNSKIVCSCDERRKFRYCASDNYSINLQCQLHNHNQVSLPVNGLGSPNKELIKKSRCVNFSPDTGCQRCIRKVEFCDACVHETSQCIVHTILPRDGRTRVGPDCSPGCRPPTALATSPPRLESIT